MAVVESLDVFEDGISGFFFGATLNIDQQLLLQCGKEALGDRIVPAVTFATHRSNNSIPLKTISVVLRGILDPAVGMEDK